MTKEIYLICEECATANGGSQPEGHLATYHRALCDRCGQVRDVTEPRDYRLNTDLTPRRKPSLYDIYLDEQDAKEKEWQNRGKKKT